MHILVLGKFTTNNKMGNVYSENIRGKYRWALIQGIHTFVCVLPKAGFRLTHFPALLHTLKKKRTRKSGPKAQLF